MGATGKLPVFIALCALAGCATISARKDVPAVIVGADACSRAALQNAVNKALDRRPVTLADDALTHNSILIVAPLRVRDPEKGIAQGRAQGRETRPPDHFRLVKSGQYCVLIHERTGRRIALVNTRCAARP